MTILRLQNPFKPPNAPDWRSWIPGGSCAREAIWARVRDCPMGPHGPQGRPAAKRIGLPEPDLMVGWIDNKDSHNNPFCLEPLGEVTQGPFGVVRVTSKEVSRCMSDSSSSAPHADDVICPGQSLMVSRCNDEEQWSCQRATVEQSWPEFVVLRFQPATGNVSIGTHCGRKRASKFWIHLHPTTAIHGSSPWVNEK